MLEQIDQQLEPVADAVVAEIARLAGMLHQLDLIDQENPGTPRSRVDLGANTLVSGIEVERPEPRLYSRDRDTIIATRMPEDGRYQHAVIDETGLPIEWRTAHRPDQN